MWCFGTYIGDVNILGVGPRGPWVEIGDVNIVRRWGFGVEIGEINI